MDCCSDNKTFDDITICLKNCDGHFLTFYRLNNRLIKYWFIYNRKCPLVAVVLFDQCLNNDVLIKTIVFSPLSESDKTNEVSWLYQVTHCAPLAPESSWPCFNNWRLGFLNKTLSRCFIYAALFWTVWIHQSIITLFTSAASKGVGIKKQNGISDEGLVDRESKGFNVHLKTDLNMNHIINCQKSTCPNLHLSKIHFIY